MPREPSFLRRANRPAWIIDVTRLFGRSDGDASVDYRIVHQRPSFTCHELMVSLNNLVNHRT